MKQSPLYLFYGNGISYFFVSDVMMSEEVSDNNVSVLSTQNSPMISKSQTPKNNDQSIQFGNDNTSTFYRPTKAKQIGDKGLQISHKGLQIKQIILARVAEDYLIFMRQFSSSSLAKMQSYYRKGTKEFKRNSSKPIKAVSNVLVLVEKNQQTNLGKAKLTADNQKRSLNYVESIIIAELDKTKGYYFLKRMKLNLPERICNVFDSNETSTILILIKNGDLYSLNLETEAFLRIATNSGVSNAKVRTSEISHKGAMISVGMDNGHFFVYNLVRQKSRLFTILTNPSKIKQIDQNDPLSHFFFKNTLKLDNNMIRDPLSKSNVTTQSQNKPNTLDPLSRLNHPLSVMDFPDNISYKSFVPEDFAPVAILSSSEDPLLTHRNIINIGSKGNKILL
jgi:hypothetical protein